MNNNTNTREPQSMAASGASSPSPADAGEVHTQPTSPASAGEGLGEGHFLLHLQARLLAAALLASLPLWAQPAHAQTTPETTTRTTEFDYHSVHGQVTLERIDPGLPTCVQKEYGYDDKGNKKHALVRPCANVTPDKPEWFAPRVSVNEFAAATTDEPGTPTGTTQHAAGAYLTRTQNGAPDAAGTGVDPAQPRTEEQAAYDVRHGAAVRQTTVALGDPNKSLHARTEYDGFGRVQRQTSALGTYVLYEYKTCRIPGQTSPDPVCLNISAEVVVTTPSKRLVGAAGDVTDTATARAISAYYVQSTPYAADDTVMGAVSRVHHDALHREIAKETQAYDGRWSRTVTAYDQLGQAAASWSAHFATSNTAEPLRELMQWTAKRDLLHRPVEQRHWSRNELSATAVEVKAATITYKGLETRAITPAGLASAPSDTGDTGERTTTSIKNAAGQVAQVIDAQGATLNHAYDAVGQLRKSVDALGNTTTISYTPTTARFKTSIEDPSLGPWSYTYDALGQLKTETDAKSQLTRLSYDVLGRLTEKLNDDLDARWYHDRIPAGSPGAGGWCAAGLSRLCEVTAGNATGTNPLQRQRTTYDPLGRPTATETTLDRAYTSSVSYQANTGAVDTYTYPSGFAIKHVYSTAASLGGSGKVPGVLEQVSDAAPGGRVFWRIDTQTAAQVFNARGQLQQALLGNGVLVQNEWDSISGKALALRAGTAVDHFNIQNSQITYDQINNVVRRYDAVSMLSETFGYDLLDRLTTYGVGATANAPAMRTITLGYNAIGSLLSKSDVGGYAYNPSGDNSVQPHAVRSAGGTTYQYDDNGNLQSTTGAQVRSHTWTAFNQPGRMQYADRTVSFLYDHDHKRVQERVTYRDSNVPLRTTYMVHPDNAGGLAYEREITSSKDESRHYVSVGGAVVAVVKTLNSGGTLNPTVSSDPAMTQYWHRDALGSIVVVSHANQAVERMAYDAWGRRIQSTGANDATLNPAHGDRGFTGHEHLDELALVHMNGRIYDPLIARFLGADPVIQLPDDLQNFNRYSYVLNNPLKYTDPSGNCFLGFDTAVCAFAALAGMAMQLEGNKHWRIVGTVLAAAAMTAPNGVLTELGVTNAVAKGAIAGGFGGFFGSGGDWEAAASGAFFGGATASIGQVPLSDPARVLLHALVGCAQGAASGGKCGPSAMAAGFGKWTTIEIGDNPANFQDFLATTVAGGTASVIGGGKFAKGALQAAMGYVLNQAQRWKAIGRGLLGKGGLQAHEGGTARGHTIDKHVKITDEAVIDRVAKGKQAAAKFYSREIAEEAVNRALIVNDSKIIQFVYSNEARWKNLESIEFTYNHQGRVGWGVVKDVPGRIDTTTITVTIVRNATMPGGYQIVRAFPNVLPGKR
jgi:RHS repeat-associated protein